MSQIDKILTRGVSEVLPSKNELKNVMEKRKITLFQGFDPTSENLHIGHLVGIRKLAQFQKAGHKVIFLIGGFTAMVGDPTDKSAVRVKLSEEDIKKNLKSYKEQVGTILRFDGENPAKVVNNHDWLSELKFSDVLDLASNLTVQQMLERDFFRQRIKSEKPIYLHEFLYPLMQGYDSVHMGVDLELGATDQLFNMMAGRTLMKALKGEEKHVLTMKLLEDPSGKKMGKTEGNAVNLTDTAENIFGGMMALPDGFIDRGIELMTDLPLDHAKGKEPMEAKKDLAFEVVAQVKGEVEAKKAKEHFEHSFQKGAPSFDESVKKEGNLLDLVSTQVESRSIAKRLLGQNAIQVDGATISDPSHKIVGGEEVKIGKRKFVKVEK